MEIAMTKNSMKSKSKSVREIENCRVVEVGVAGFAECVQQGPASCSHALPFGYCFLCMHPRLDEIIENTKRAQQAVKAN
jgi:hypothetical protein